MKLKTLRIITLLSLLILTANESVLFAQSDASAKTAVESFYKFYRTRNGIISTHELNFLKPWFTSELTKLFQNEIRRESLFAQKHPDEKPYFGDGFPFNPYEECIVNEKIILNKIEIGEAKIAANSAAVEVKFSIPKECEAQVSEPLIDTYVVKLTKVKTRWLINDWIFSDKSSLLDILRREKY